MSGRLDAQQSGEVVFLPESHAFQPLLADPKEPAFFAAYVSTATPARTTGVGSTGLGENIGLIGRRDRKWDLSVAAAVFSQFDMQTASNELLNSDFIVGVPFGWHAGQWSLRVRLYHQSSHLGDEYLISTGATRVNYSFESLEAIGSRDVGALRLYAGAEDLVRRDPSSLRPLVIHWGVEWARQNPRLFGRVAKGRPFAALDAKSSEERHWRTGWSARAGYEFATSSAGGRRWSVDLRGYSGPSPYGQFYETDVKAIGAGISFSL